MYKKRCLVLIFIMVFLEKRWKFHGRRGRNQTTGPDIQRLHHCILSKNMMADDKEVFDNDFTQSPEFIQELLSSAERTALFYHLSYLCLGNFPKLERPIRQRALETQLLFGSSEALLLKCVGTSENLVTSLLPNLKVAVEKNKPQLAVKFLEKSKEWINDIIKDVKTFVNRYEKHNRDVAALTSNIITVKEKTKTAQQQKQQQQTSEMEALQKIMDGLEVNLGEVRKEIEDYEEKIEEKKSEIDQFISSIKENMQQTDTDMILWPLTPFMDTMSNIYKIIKSTSDEYQMGILHADLSKTTESQKRLKDQEWNIQIQLMDKQQELFKLNIENGQMPSVTHLDDVQKSLSRIQQTLVQLQKFWEKVGSLLDTLKDRTFAGEIWMEELTDMKIEILESIDAAQEEWIKFGTSCMKANKILSIQSNEAYRFLEISPSSLSEEEWKKESESVKEKLKNIRTYAAGPPIML